MAESPVALATRSPAPPPAQSTRLFGAGLLVFILGLLATLSWQGYQKQFVYAVEVDGSLLGHVATKDEWRQALEDTRAWAETQMGLPVALRSSVRLSKVEKDPTRALLSPEVLAQASREKLDFVAQVWAVSIGGKDVAYLRTEQEARQVIPSLVEDYRRGVLAKGNTTVLEVSVVESTDCHPAQASVAEVGDVERAKRILLRGTDRLLTHVVARGETLWGIAKSNSLTVADLRKANPNLQNINSLRVGQEINLIVPDPYITLKSRERYSFVRYLGFPEEQRRDSSKWPWESYVEKRGVPGREQVTVEIARTNGDETSRKTLSVDSISGPEAQVYVMGTKLWPTRADGWVWPAVGRITSGYGWRRREFHHGVDIGAPFGTQALAAKAGTVTYAGWRHGYGNLVIVDHAGGYETYYGHLSAFLVAVGDKVSRGQAIGRVGSTGRSTGPHVHFEIHLNGKTQNPTGFYPRGG